MKVSLSWLREYVAIDMPVEALVDALTMAGLEVDAVNDRYRYLDTVRVGRVLAVEAHPNADRLKICRVDTGDGIRSVVCGAPNVAADQTIAIALPGTAFPDGSVLEPATIRGVQSAGMICSESELGLGTEASGIMVLEGAPALGSNLAEALGISDTTLDIDLTPNRPDCLSVMGVAREIAALQKTELEYPDFSLTDGDQRISDLTSVTVLDPGHCPRYTARLITDIRVAPSPFWLQDRLMSIGQRPINNIVDITNFVMMETGQPLHAFDFDRLEGKKLVVRTAAAGESFTTLDGKPRQLDPETLMICDGEKPVAVGGVMGGLNSEIEAHTRSVLLESAYFLPTSIRKTAKRLGLNTEASHRFERGVDPEGTIPALNRAARLMAELGGGRLVGGVIDEYPGTIAPKTVFLDVNRTNRLLGTALNRDQIREHLESIEFSVTPEGTDALAVRPPSFRVDIQRPEDLMEEVARLSGYNHIPTTFPVMAAAAPPGSRRLTTRDAIRKWMTGFGYMEAINYSFVSSSSCDRLLLDRQDPRRRTVQIMNPISDEQTEMRSSMIPGLLETMGRNLARQTRNLRVFEIGKVYMEGDGENTGNTASPAVETEMLAALWTGSRTDGTWHSAETACDFFDIKGTVEGLVSALGIAGIRFSSMPAGSCWYTRPGHTAVISAGGMQVGLVGELKPEVLAAYDLKKAAFIFELEVDRILPLIPEEKTFLAIPKFPAVTRDITLIIDRHIETGSVLEGVLSQGQQLIESLQLFDVYQGQPIPPEKKSISFRITYRSSERTLEDEKVNTLHEQITGRLIDAFDAGLPV